MVANYADIKKQVENLLSDVNPARPKYFKVRIRKGTSPIPDLSVIKKRDKAHRSPM